MDNNLHNDSLEEFFRKHLEREENPLSEDDGWDVPSDAVWEGVEIGLPKKEKPKRRIIPYWRWVGVAAAILLLLGFFQLQKYQQQLNHLTTELHVHQEELKEVKEKLDVSENDFAKQIEKDATKDINQQRIQDQGVASEEIISSGVTPSSNTKKKNRANEVLKKEVKDIAEEEIREDVNTLLGMEKVIAPTSNSQYAGTVNSKTSVIRKPLYFAEIKQRSTYATIENIPPIKLLTPQLEKQLDLYIQMSKGFGGNINDIIPPKNSGFYVGANLAPTVGFRKLKGEEDEPRFEKIKGKETAQMTIAGGLKLGYQINDRWSIESGVQLAKLKIKTEHRFEKQYTSDNEVPNSMGDLENNYAILLTTSFGDLVDEIPMSRSAQHMIAENTAFDLKMESEQTLTKIGVPLVAKYRLGNQRTKLNFKGGVMSSFVVDSGMKVKPVGRPLPHLKPEDRKFKNKKLKIEGQQLVTFDLMMGVEAEFKLSKSTYFSLEPTFSQSVTPIFERDGVKAYPSVASLNVGVNHYF